MPCYDIQIRGPREGEAPIFGIACTRGAARRRRCTGCCRNIADRLCDVPISAGRGKRPATCSAPVCSRCTVRLGDDVDVCPAHAVPEEALAAAAVGGRR